MISAGHLFLLSVGIFIVYAILISLEKRRGKRVVLAGFRNWLDSILTKLTAFFGRWFSYIGRYIIKLSWYYGVHRFLRFILTMLVKSYDNLEGLFLRNRDRAKVIKTEKRKIKSSNHFDLVADHKATSALSEPEKKALLAKKLERE